MQVVELSHLMNIHTPGWVGYAGNKMYYVQNMQTARVAAQRIETALHAGTHFDGAMHATDGRSGDMASLPLDYLVSQGVVSILPQMIGLVGDNAGDDRIRAGAEIRDGDILILHTGWHRLLEGQKQQDLVRYFCYHPGRCRDARMDAQARRSSGSAWIPVLRPSDEHLDPQHAARYAAQFEQGMGSSAADYFGSVRIHPQAIGP